MRPLLLTATCVTVSIAKLVIRIRKKIYVNQKSQRRWRVDLVSKSKKRYMWLVGIKRGGLNYIRHLYQEAFHYLFDKALIEIVDR